jgi:hypothetical protein
MLGGILREGLGIHNYRKVPGLGKKNAGLAYSILAAISFKIVSMGTYTAIPYIFFFFPRLKSTVEVIFLNAVEYRLRFPLDIRHCFKTPLYFIFNLGNKAKSQGAKSGE